MALGRRRRHDVADAVAPDPFEVAGADPLLGTLRSELDDDVSLPSLFSEVHDRTAEIRMAVVAGEKARDAAARALSGLRIAAPDGTVWACGATSLNWFRKLPGGSWSRHVPPLGDEATAYRLLEPVGGADVPTPDVDATPAGAATPAAASDRPDGDAGLLSLDDLASLAQDLDGDAGELPSGLASLPELPDDPARPVDGTHEALDITPVVAPGASAADTDDVLGDDGRLGDDDLARLSGQTTDDAPADDVSTDLRMLEQLRALGAFDDRPTAEVDLPGDDDEVDEDSGYGAAGSSTDVDWAIGLDDADDDGDELGYGGYGD